MGLSLIEGLVCVWGGGVWFWEPQVLTGIPDLINTIHGDINGMNRDTDDTPTSFVSTSWPTNTREFGKSPDCQRLKMPVKQVSGGGPLQIGRKVAGLANDKRSWQKMTSALTPPTLAPCQLQLFFDPDCWFLPSGSKQPQRFRGCYAGTVAVQIDMRVWCRR